MNEPGDAFDLTGAEKDTMAVSVSVPLERAIATPGEHLVEAIKNLPVTTNEEYQEAAKRLAFIKTAESHFETEEKSLTRPLLEVVERLRARFRGGRASLEQARKSLEAKMVGFVTAQAEKLRLEKEAAARKQAEEQRRIRDEAEAKERAAREVAAKAKAEADAKAAKLAESGKEAEAARVRAKAEADQVKRDERAAADRAAAEKRAADVPVERTTFNMPLAKGTSIASKKVGDVTDKAEFFIFCARNLKKRPDLLNLWDVNEAKLNARAREAGDEPLGFDGVAVRDKASVRSSSI